MRSFSGQPSIVMQDVDRTVPPSIVDPAQHADVLDRPADLGIEHVAECLSDLCFGDHRVLSGSKLVDTVCTVEIHHTARLRTCPNRHPSRSTKRSPTIPGIGSTAICACRAAAGLIGGKRQLERAESVAREWGADLVGRSVPRPGARASSGLNLAVLQGALAEAGFDPRFRRRSAKTVEISLRDCPFRDLLDEHRDLVCAVHRGLLEGMLGASRPPLRLTEFEPLVERSAVCRLVARGA